MSTIDFIFLGITLFAAVYWLGALGSVVVFHRRRPAASHFVPPVTVLKPLKGDDGQLYENLRTVCVQDYPTYQVIFGVRERDDPAIAVVERLLRELPEVDLTLVVDERAIGTNPKISNLANLVGHAKYDALVLADSDIRVGPGYLRAVVAPLEDPAVGLVTCLYRGVGARGVVSRLGAMFVNEWFFPAALVSTRLGPLRHAFGATIAARRDTLRAIGGVEAVADQLADDYMLGRLVSRQGFRVVLAPYVVNTIIADRDLGTLFFRELRWARTLRTLRPVSYFCSLLTYGFPLSLLWLAAGAAGRLACAAAVVHIGLRCVGRLVLDRSIGLHTSWSEVCLVPVRDLASCLLGVLSFLGSSVRWDDERFRVRRDGCLERRSWVEGWVRLDRTVGPAPLGSKREEST
jgi:ceramide glucosyltransferase